MENFRFEMTKVYSEIPPQWKTSDLRWPKFTLINPPQWKTSDLRWPKFTPKYPPPPEMENFRFEMTKVYSEIPPTPPPNGLESGRSYLETNLYPPWIPLVTLFDETRQFLFTGNWEILRQLCPSFIQLLRKEILWYTCIRNVSCNLQ